MIQLRDFTNGQEDIVVKESATKDVNALKNNNIKTIILGCISEIVVYNNNEIIN